MLLRASRGYGTVAERAEAGGEEAFLQGLRELVDGVLPIGTLNAEYWRHYLGDDLPQFLMPYAVDNDYFQTAQSRGSQTGGELLAELKLDRRGR